MSMRQPQAVHSEQDFSADATPLSKGDWAAVVAGIAAHTLETEALWRRDNPRFGGDYGSIKVVFQQAVDGVMQTVIRTTPILDVSVNGIGVKSHKSIEPGTGVAMRISVDGVPHTLLGRVVKSTATLGGVRIGIELVFVDP